MNDKSKVYCFGILGILAALITGIGEFLMHYGPAPSSKLAYAFLINIPQDKVTLGHFIGVIGAPLYIAGYYHIYLMLGGAKEKLAKVIFGLSIVTFMFGMSWLSSRALLSDIVKLVSLGEAPTSLLDSYTLHSESLINIVRVCVLLLSVLFSYAVLKRKNIYPKFMALINPILCMIAFILLYLILPSIGKFFVPILLNAGHFVFFSFSVYILNRSKGELSL